MFPSNTNNIASGQSDRMVPPRNDEQKGDYVLTDLEQDMDIDDLFGEEQVIPSVPLSDEGLLLQLLAEHKVLVLRKRAIASYTLSIPDYESDLTTNLLCSIPCSIIIQSSSYLSCTWHEQHAVGLVERRRQVQISIRTKAKRSADPLAPSNNKQVLEKTQTELDAVSYKISLLQDTEKEVLALDATPKKNGGLPAIRYKSLQRDFVKILSDLSGPTSALRAQKEQKSPQDSTAVGPLRNKNNHNNRFSAYKKSSIKESTRPAPGSYQCSRCGVNNTHNTNDRKYCNHCKKPGHTFNECRNRQRLNGNGKNDNEKLAHHKNANFSAEGAYIKQSAKMMSDKNTASSNICISSAITQAKISLSENKQTETYTDDPTDKTIKGTVAHKASHKRTAGEYEDKPSTMLETARKKINDIDNKKEIFDKQAFISSRNPYHKAMQNPEGNYETIDWESMIKNDLALHSQAVKHPCPEIIKTSSLSKKDDNPHKAPSASTLQQADKRIVVHVVVNSERMEALLDMGATDSSIRKDIVANLGIHTTPIDGMVQGLSQLL
ncbi:hypothetical protein BCR41DRAFT_401630 [Lobosporangium transversale]|uniref:Uncharacterized protein n=1 Tax=Lobosporangium transversale TaxID=64571 RepID=A0A1Y2G7E3_9FUNG|nr:hypothetical protein BCR41DRAFT_401630 [Lobosporangium transversale]ORY99788.1 hypothetical protein BCR41DRAFT_401630 [Lobosporangium transversale]|eukprot:XP_021876022.1 hypothetical protein BCR41DRAFT_401630 [Lobosporangium transversale]